MDPVKHAEDVVAAVESISHYPHVNDAMLRWEGRVGGILHGWRRSPCPYGRRPSVGEDSVLDYMVQRADAAKAQDRRDLCVFILVENELESNLEA